MEIMISLNLSGSNRQYIYKYILITIQRGNHRNSILEKKLIITQNIYDLNLLINLF